MEEKHTKTIKSLVESIEKEIKTKEELIVKTKLEIKKLNKDYKKLSKFVEVENENITGRSSETI